MTDETAAGVGPGIPWEFVGESPRPVERLTLWYRRPAHAARQTGAGPDAPGDDAWVDALPVGNGRLGAMVFGGIGHERIQLNEDSMWAGSPQDADNPEAERALPEIRRLLQAGDQRAAEERAGRSLVCKGPGTGFG
ncbi:MAG TPA: glycoside hydrolase N-terminal domain-containing protein, partial [Armatimonadota bacterium]|nr:glycoside hydrolase N-terminal domain-containing protein [Armatimonadota bacterium]